MELTEREKELINLLRDFKLFSQQTQKSLRKEINWLVKELMKN